MILFKFKNKVGQSSIEFLFTIFLSLSIVFMFISLCLNYTSGYMAHLATYMAGRTYMVMDDYSLTGWDRFSMDQAKEAFKRFQIEKYVLTPNAAIGTNGLGFNSLLGTGQGGNNEVRRKKLMVGAFFSFSQKLFYSVFGGVKELNLRSEAFLGKEVPRHECKKRICEAMKARIGHGQSCDNPNAIFEHATLFDNGC